MATLNAYSQLTWAEVAKRLDPKGKLETIVEVLSQDNELVKDALWIEANGKTYHKITRRFSLPTGTWRKANSGVAAEASRTVEISETLGSLESYAECDVAIINAAGNPIEARNQENIAFLEGMGQELTATMIYGNTATAPEEIDGLATRMASIDADGLVINEGGSGGDTCSVYCVIWGPNEAFMSYMKGTKAGITHKDLGQVTAVASDGTMHEVYRDHFKVGGGLVVKDPKCIARLANIDPSSGTYTFDEDNLITLLNRMKGRGKRAVIYANERVFTQMQILMKDKTNVNFLPGKGNGLSGEPVFYFNGCPVRMVEQILNTETAVA